MSSKPITLDRVGVVVPATRPAPPKPTPAPVAPTSGKDKPKRPFTTGFCGSGPVCRDTRGNCHYAIGNGLDASVKVLYCACACHDGKRHPDDPAKTGTPLPA